METLEKHDKDEAHASCVKSLKAHQKPRDHLSGSNVLSPILNCSDLTWSLLTLRLQILDDLVQRNEHLSRSESWNLLSHYVLQG